MDKGLLLFNRFQDIREKRSSGVLHLRENSDRIEIHFREGRVEAVSSNLKEHRLGQYLVNKGSVKAPALRKLLEKSRREGIALGETALRKGLVRKQTLRKLVYQQARDLLGLCLENGFNIDLFQSESSLREYTIHTDLDAVLLDLARSATAPEEVRSSRSFVVKEEDTLSSLPCPRRKSPFWVN